jgi:hypothetical protein
LLRKLTRYVRAHWSGELSLLTSVFVNGLAIYAVLVAAFVGLGQVVKYPAFVYAGLIVFLLWAVWSGVGIFRSAIRTYRSNESSLLRRIWAVCAMIGVLAVGAFILKDLVFLFG